MPFLADCSRFMAVTLSADGLIVSLSSSAEQITGYSALELVGRPITQILADKSAFEVPRMLCSAREWGAWAGEVIHRNRSGNSVEARSTVTSLTGRANTHTGFLLVSAVREDRGIEIRNGAPFREVSERLRAFSHELNNPLAVLMGFAQLIMLSPQCTGKIRGDMEKINAELDRVIEVVEQLHNYAMALNEKGQPEGIRASG